MSEYDELDQLLQEPGVSEEDFKSLATVLKIDDPVPRSAVKRRKLFNSEIRHCYGHTFANVFRNEYEPDYGEIVRAVASKLKLRIPDGDTITDIEHKIVVAVIENAKAQIIKEKGQAAWDSIEADAEEEIRKRVAEGKFPKEVLDDLKKLRGGMLLAALIGGRLAGIGLYLVANQIFFAIARNLGLRIGVAIAGPIIGRTLAFLLGPAGWVLGGIWLLYDFGNTSWRKVVPAVVIVAMLRARLQFEGN